MNKNTIRYVVLAILIICLLLLTLFPGVTHTIKDSGNSVEDKCSPGPGYTEESWREHMSHHPNVYAECLG